MKKQKVQAKINLEALAGGAFAEKLNEALRQQNITIAFVAVIVLIIALNRFF